MIRDAIPKSDTLSEIDQYLAKARSVTPYDLTNRFGIRMSVARKILREKEVDGTVVPYIRESGFVVYTTPTEIAKREGGAPIMTADVLEEISASVTHDSVIDDDMEAALAAAASSAGTVVKPSKLARRRREVGDRKERKESRPEIVVEPLPKEESVDERPTKIEERPKKVEEKPKKVEERSKKEPKKAEEKPKKVEEKPKKEPKKVEEKPKKVEEKSKKEPKKAEEKPKKVEEKPKKEPKKVEEKPKKVEEKPKKIKKPELEDIDGIGPKTAEILRDSGFKTVASLSKTTVEKLSKKVDGIAETTATQYIESAKKLIDEYENAKE